MKVEEITESNIDDLAPLRDDGHVETKASLEEEADDCEEKNLQEVRRMREEHLSVDEIDTLRAKAATKKTEGNECFARGDYIHAIAAYAECIEVCPLQFCKDHSVFHGNIAACHIKLENWEDAVKSAGKGCELDGDNMKFVERRAFARFKKGGDLLELAAEDYQKLVEMVDNAAIRRAHEEKLKLIEQAIQERNEKLKEQLFSGLKTFGNFCLKPFGLSTDSFELQQQDGGGYSINMKQQ